MKRHTLSPRNKDGYNPDHAEYLKCICISVLDTNETFLKKKKLNCITQPNIYYLLLTTLYHNYKELLCAQTDK